MIYPDNNQVLKIEQGDIVTLNFEDLTIEINLENLKAKIIENQELIQNNRQQYYLDMIKDFVNVQNAQNEQNEQYVQNVQTAKNKIVCQIEVQSEAVYNFVLKQYKLINEQQHSLLTMDQDLIKKFQFKFQMQTTNYTSNVNNENERKYLKYSSSPKLILRKQNEENQQIEIPLSFNLSTGIYECRKENLVLQRSQNEEIPLNIQWKFDKENSEIQLDLDAPGCINNVAIKAVLYSRIIIKESDDYVAQTHKILRVIERNIVKRVDKQSLIFYNIVEKYPPLFFGEKIISHHIVILTLDFKIKSSNDLFKKNLFQIEIPVDLYPDEKKSENLTQIYQENYFDQIRLLEKSYKDYQQYI